MLGIITILGAAIFALGCWMHVKMQKRVFERTNASGVMEFDDFRQSYKFTLQNRALKAGSVVFFLIGAFMFAIGMVVMTN